ncbi:type IV toxin-antitoxin system AbiEi family antitoxin domain-containing protein [Nocardia sp. NPDC052316]|uniref:type IV toxin-antitoxin system AbiEi family antitoxin domain-containing protein n=1 Tax=Nocardia sp. NPDC052316 TaxID=3364329 RepID=UPI0037C76D46
MDAPQLISRRQALAAGMSDSQLQRLCRSGQWQRIRAGHYVNAPQPALTPAGRHLMLVLAMCEAMSDDAVASHCSALVLHGLPTWSIPLERAHVTRDRIAGGRIRKQLVLHSAQIAPDEITLINGVRVTTVPRTIFDITRSVGFEYAVVCGDSALRQGLTTVGELGEHLRRAAHRRGARQAARAIEFLDGRSESVGESRSRVAFQESGLPAPELQARVCTDDAVCVGRVDFLFDELGVIGEFEGQSEQHSALGGARLPAQWTVAAPDRDDQLRALGWAVVRWTWTDLDDPVQLAERIRAAAEVARRAHRTGHWIPTLRS